jgi:hypothetical protein
LDHKLQSIEALIVSANESARRFLSAETGDQRIGWRFRTLLKLTMFADRLSGLSALALNKA